MVTTGQLTDADLERAIRPFRMNIDRYLKLIDSGIFNKQDEVFLWKGRIVEKIREGVEPRTDGECPEHRLSVERFLRMVDAGILTEQDHVFLWKGSLLEIMTKGRRQSHSAVKLDHLLVKLLPAAYHAELEQPMRLANDSLPEPDVMILRGTVDDYDGRIPTARDVAWLAEVADSGVIFDFNDKLEAYAAEAIPVYWVVDLPGRRIVAFTLPTGPAEKPSYHERREYGPDDEVPIWVDGLELGRVLVREVLPRDPHPV